MPDRRREDPGTSDDRREDEPTRKRVDEIASAYNSAVREQWRWLKGVAAGLAIMAIVAFLTGPVVYMMLQGQRLAATRQSCLSKDQTADSTVKLLISLGVRAEVTQLARKTYPREGDCEAAARVAVAGPVLFDGAPVTTPPPPMLTPAEVRYCDSRCVR